QPVENPHKAFCTPGCYSSFYLRRCAVCEKEKPAGSTARRILCRRRKCESAYRQNRAFYAFPVPDTALTANVVRNVDKSGTFPRDLDDRPWRIVAGPVISANTYHCAAIPIDPDTAKRTAAAKDQDRIRSEITWSPRQPHSPIDVTTHSRWQPSWQPQWPSPTDDLSIPKFLKRDGGTS